MRNSWPRASMVLIALMSALAVAGCAGKPKKPTLAYIERPVEQLYAAGSERLDRGNWNEAVDYFKEVERQHPYSEWARRAVLMTAYAHYQGNQYADAIDDADRFLSLFPGNPSAVYAYYLKAVCYFEQIVDVGRDQASTEQALAGLRDVVQRFPKTEYAADARLKIDMVNDQLAGKEMTIGRFYLREGETLSAMGRFRTVIDRYQTTSHTPEALYRLIEVDLTLGLMDEARRNGAVLGYNFPGDRWYADAYKLLTDKGLRPAVEPADAPRAKGIMARLIPARRTALPPATIAQPVAAPEPAAPVASSATQAEPKPKKKSLWRRLIPL